MNRDEMWLLREKYGGEKSEAFFADRDRLAQGEPLAYIIGTIPFLGTTIHLDSHPLIPRTETEFWVNEIIPTLRKKKSNTILDLCAGSGCIGIAVLARTEVARVDFAEIDSRHHPTIEKNINLNNIAHTRARVYGGDLFACLTDTYDFILTNPPYIDPAHDRTELSVRVHEPHNALYGGMGGMEIITRIIAHSPRYLTPHGTLIVEHEPEQTIAIQLIGTHHGFSGMTYRDQYHTERFTTLTRAVA